MKQVTDEFDIVITWSEAQPEQAGKTLQQIADEWQVSLHDAAARLMPAGAIYHNMDEQDVRRVMRYPVTMIGSDGLPNDPMPHPRLWGAFPRVLGHYSATSSYSADYRGTQDDRAVGGALPAGGSRAGENWLLCRPGAV